MADAAKHAGDCTIFASLSNDRPECGICTCGAGLRALREGDWSQMYSDERVFREYLRCAPAADHALLDSIELGDRLKISYETVNKWARERRIPSIELPSGKRRFAWDAVCASLRLCPAVQSPEGDGA